MITWFQFLLGNTITTYEKKFRVQGRANDFLIYRSSSVVCIQLEKILDYFRKRSRYMIIFCTRKSCDREILRPGNGFVDRFIRYNYYYTSSILEIIQLYRQVFFCFMNSWLSRWSSSCVLGITWSLNCVLWRSYVSLFLRFGCYFRSSQIFHLHYFFCVVRSLLIYCNLYMIDSNENYF